MLEVIGKSWDHVEGNPCFVTEEPKRFRRPFDVGPEVGFDLMAGGQVVQVFVRFIFGVLDP